MIDTCQANTMYSKFYSPNIIATGSSAIDESSYSHHADNDVGVAVIDRYTYYNLDFLETQVKDQFSKLTLGDLFDSYNFDKIHSNPGFRYDLIPGNEEAARNKLVMDFFGNVQNVEVDTTWNETAWRDDLARLGKLVEEAQKRNNTSTPDVIRQKPEVPVASPGVSSGRATKVESGNDWTMRLTGTVTVVGALAVWAAATWFDSAK
jgi:phosphatidylinositol glycan class K